MKSELLNYESNLEKKIVIQKSEPTCMKKAFRQEKSLFLGVKAEKQGSECPMIPTLGLKKTMIRNKLLVTLTLLLAAVLAGCDDDRFAISFHRARRSKRTLVSQLEDIPGIGKQTKFLLLKELGSVDKIAEASLEELMEIKGIGKKTATRIREYFDNADEQEDQPDLS